MHWPVLAALVFIPFAAALGGPADSVSAEVQVRREIEYLIGQVRRSPAMFFMEGTEIRGTVAANNMQSKEEYYRQDLKTVDDFVRLVCTSSAKTGECYHVRHLDGSIECLDLYLNHILDVHRQKLR